MEVKVKFISPNDIWLTRPDGSFMAHLHFAQEILKSKQKMYGQLIEAYLFNANRIRGKVLNPWQQLEYVNRRLMANKDFPNSFSRVVTDEELNRCYLGTQLQKLRKHRKMSLRAVARMSDIDYGNLSKIENGKVSVGYDVLCRLLQTLDGQIDIVPKIALDKLKLND